MSFPLYYLKVLYSYKIFSSKWKLNDYTEKEEKADHRIVCPLKVTIERDQKHL